MQASLFPLFTPCPVFSNHTQAPSRPLRVLVCNFTRASSASISSARRRHIVGTPYKMGSAAEIAEAATEWQATERQEAEQAEQAEQAAALRIATAVQAVAARMQTMAARMQMHGRIGCHPPSSWAGLECSSNQGTILKGGASLWEVTP